MIDEVYKLDAYHSLSIEGYQVTPELVQAVIDRGADVQAKSKQGLNALESSTFDVMLVPHTIGRTLLGEAPLPDAARVVRPRLHAQPGGHRAVPPHRRPGRGGGDRQVLGAGGDQLSAVCVFCSCIPSKLGMGREAFKPGLAIPAKLLSY